MGVVVPKSPPNKCAACIGDLDGDNTVGITDLLDLLAGWGSCPGCPADLDGNSMVNITDLLTLLGVWGDCS